MDTKRTYFPSRLPKSLKDIQTTTPRISFVPWIIASLILFNPAFVHPFIRCDLGLQPGGYRTEET